MQWTIIDVFDLLVHVFFAGFGSFCFGVLFGVPCMHYLACGVNGAIGWFIYLLCMAYQPSTTIATLMASLVLTIVARLFAVFQKAPIIVFLFCGIFPLVPGASLYYTAYYFMQGENMLCLEKGIETFKIAVALAIGISIVLALPLALFRKKNVVHGREKI